MPRKSVKKIMKELMAKKNLTTKEKKLLAKMKKGGGFFDFSWLFGSKTTTPVDQATLTKQFDDLKGQVCKVCKAAFGEDGCKCGNTAPPPEEPSTNPNVPVSPLNDGQMSTGEGDIKSQELSNPSMEPTDESQPQPKDTQTGKMGGGKRKSYKNKNKRSKRASKKMKW
jgi:hypothetical protein